MLSEKRKGRITASSVGAILGCDPFRTADDVMRDMVREYHGAEREFKGNVATEYGHANEPVAKAQFEADNDCLVLEREFAIHPVHGWLGATPDGVISSDDEGLDGALIEIKCPYSMRDGGQFKALEEQPHYYHQVQAQLHCTGIDACWFVQWSPEKLVKTLVPKSTQWADVNIPTLKAFYDRYLKVVASEELSAPYLDDKIVDMDSNEEWQTITAHLKTIKKSIAEYQELEKAAKARLIELANGRPAKGHGVSVYWNGGRSSVDYKKLVADNNIDIAPYEKTGAGYWVVR